MAVNVAGTGGDEVVERKPPLEVVETMQGSKTPGCSISMPDRYPRRI